MELELKNRSFKFSDNITKQLFLKKYDEFYLLNTNHVVMKPQLKNYSSTLSYNNTDLSLYHLKHINSSDTFRISNLK
jgi:hypothetical protein